MHIVIINGPNLNLLGTREPEIYGNKNFETFLNELQIKYVGIKFEYHQSNIEGELVTHLQQSQNADGILLNVGAYTHTSIAIADAIAAIKTPVIEIHISNILAREVYRKTSYIAEKCIGSISGLGLDGYELALIYFTKKMA